MIQDFPEKLTVSWLFKKLPSFMGYEASHGIFSSPLLFHVFTLLATGWTTGVRLPAGTGNFVFTPACRPDLGPTEPPIRWVSVVTST